MTNIDSAGLALIEKFEGYVDHIYHDVGGVATIGYGTTAGAGVVSPLPATCTRAEAEKWLMEYVDRSVVPEIVATGARLTQHQVDALCSLGYNYGAGIFGTGWEIGRALRANDIAAVPGIMRTMDLVDGRPNSSLAARREEEIALFLEPEPVEDPNHYKWFIPRETTAVKRYDALRKLTSLSKKEKLWLASRQRQCKTLARLVLIAATTHRVKGKPSWSLYRRGWRYQELVHRGQGKKVAK